MQTDIRTRMEALHELNARSDYMSMPECDKEKFCAILSQMNPRYRFGRVNGYYCESAEDSLTNRRLRSRLHFLLKRVERREQSRICMKRYRALSNQLNTRAESSHEVEAQ